MTIPTWPQSSIFVAWRQQTIQQTQPPPRISLPPFHNERNYIRKIVLLFQLAVAQTGGAVLDLRKSFVQLMFTANSLFLWPFFSVSWENNCTAPGFTVIQSVQPLSRKAFFIFAPLNHTLSFTHSTKATVWGRAEKPVFVTCHLRGICLDGHREKRNAELRIQTGHHSVRCQIRCTPTCYTAPLFLPTSREA